MSEIPFEMSMERGVKINDLINNIVIIYHIVKHNLEEFGKY